MIKKIDKQELETILKLIEEERIASISLKYDNVSKSIMGSYSLKGYTTVPSQDDSASIFNLELYAVITQISECFADIQELSLWCVESAITSPADALNLVAISGQNVVKVRRSDNDLLDDLARRLKERGVLDKEITLSSKCKGTTERTRNINMYYRDIIVQIKKSLV